MTAIMRSFLISITMVCLSIPSLYGRDDYPGPVTPGASEEARALLAFLYSISGKYILTGQHNYPNIKDRNTRFAADYIGKTPVIFSTDWGFAGDGDKDSYLARPDIVEECIRQHQLGSIITICWHAVPPTADEPVTFSPPSGASPDSLSSIQGKLTDQQFVDILTPGTELYRRWCVQVDTIAYYLKKLQAAYVPILWRPYHEMNGNWFWWGGRHGEYGTRALYVQLFDRFVNHHKLNNLIWLWSVDRPVRPEMQFSDFYPGSEYLDILSLDVYGNDFKQEYYDSLLALSEGKPLVLGEVGNPPSLKILDSQSGWTYYVIWAGLVRNTLKRQYKVLVSDPRVLSMEDPAYAATVAPYRSACGLPLLPVKLKQSPDFSGKWVFSEEKSTLDNSGIFTIPYKLDIIQEGNNLTVQRIRILEYADDEITEEKITLDGKEYKSEFWNSPRITTAKWSGDGKNLIFESRTTLSRGGNTFEMVVNEIWTLTDYGDILSVEQSSTSPRGSRKITIIYDRQ